MKRWTFNVDVRFTGTEEELAVLREAVESAGGTVMQSRIVVHWDDEKEVNHEDV